MKLLQKFDTTFFKTQCIYPLYIYVCKQKQRIFAHDGEVFFLKTRGGSEKAR